MDSSARVASEGNGTSFNGILEEAGGWYGGVVDSHGGVVGAKVSESVGKYLQNLRVTDDPSQIATDLRAIFAEIDEAMIEYSGGCSATVLVVTNRFVISANIGCCGAFLMRHNRPMNLTKLHYPSQETERRRIISQGGLIVPTGVTVAGLTEAVPVSRCFGFSQFKNVELPGQSPIIAIPEVSVLRVERCDQFVIAASSEVFDIIPLDALAMFVSSRIDSVPVSDICREIKVQVVDSTPRRSGVIPSQSIIIIDLRDISCSEVNSTNNSYISGNYCTNESLLKEWEMLSEAEGTNIRTRPRLGSRSASRSDIVSHVVTLQDCLELVDDPSEHLPMTIPMVLVSVISILFATWTSILGLYYNLIPAGVLSISWFGVFMVWVRTQHHPPWRVMIVLLTVSIISVDAINHCEHELWTLLLFPTIMCQVISPHSAAMLPILVTVCVVWVVLRSCLTVSKTLSFHQINSEIGDLNYSIQAGVTRTIILVGIPLLVSHALKFNAMKLGQLADTVEHFSNHQKESQDLAGLQLSPRQLRVSSTLYPLYSRIISGYNTAQRQSKPDKDCQSASSSATVSDLSSAGYTPPSSPHSGPQNFIFGAAKPILCLAVEVMQSSPRPHSDIAQFAGSFFALVCDRIVNRKGSVQSCNDLTVIATFNGAQPCPNYIQQGGHCAVQIHSSLLSHRRKYEAAGASWAIALSSGLFSQGYVNGVSSVSSSNCIQQAVSLCHLSHRLDARIMLSDKVQDVIKHQYLTRPIELVYFSAASVGKPEPVFELLGLKSAFGAKITEGNTQFTKGFSLLRQGKYSRAIEHFTQLVDKGFDRQAIRLLQYAKHLQEQGTTHPIPRRFIQWELVEGDLTETERSARRSVHSLKEEQQIFTGDSSGSAQLRAIADGTYEMKALRGAIKDAEIAANTDQLTAWGVMPPASLPSSGASPTSHRREPSTIFIDSKSTMWQRSNKNLGRGAFGEVWLGMDAVGGLVAIKAIQLPGLKIQQTPRGKRSQISHRKQLDDLIREASLMNELHHDNIVTYLSSAVVDNFVMVRLFLFFFFFVYYL